MNKTAIKNFAVWARNKLIADISYKAGLLGISDKEIKPALQQSTTDAQFFDIGAREPYRISGVEITQRKRLVEVIEAKAKSSESLAPTPYSLTTAFHAVVEEVAYTWFNRLIAVRFMEVNDYLPSRIRVLSGESGKAEPDLVTTPFDGDLEFSAQERELVLSLKNDNKLDELFRLLFIKQCNTLGEILPELFEKTDDYSELLLNISFTDKDGVVRHLVDDIVEDDFKEAVEIIGWMYQYYNTELNELVYDGNMSKSRIPKELLPAATTIYTPDWAIRYMVENSLGKLWLEGHHNDALKAKWKYYLDEVEQTPEVQAQLNKIRAEYKVLTPEDITFIDPCMGSGHILVYAFDVLMQIYESAGYSQRDAAKLILEKNLFGLDISKRAYQLAYFAVLMKARRYNRRAFFDKITPQVYHPTGDINGEELGSILIVNELEPMPRQVDGQISLDDVNFEDTLRIWNFMRLLSQKYDVVVTNPPYLGSSRFSPKLAEYVINNYSDVKSDLSTVMYKHALSDLSKPNGYVSFITTSSWMFLSSFEKLRLYVLPQFDIESIVDFGTELFEGKVGHNPIVAWVNRNSRTHKKMLAVRLVDYCYSRRDEKEPEFFNARNRHTAAGDNFAKIPGSPVAYWVSKELLFAFETGKLLSDIADPRVGLQTGENNVFLRQWYEVKRTNIGFSFSQDEAKNSELKWFPYNKGGEYRKWYGNNDFVVNWKNGGIELRTHNSSVVRNPNYQFRQSITWSLISSSATAFRYKPEGFLFDVAGMSMFPDEECAFEILAFCNSIIAFEMLRILAPTMNFQVGDIARLPFIENDKSVAINRLAKTNIAVAKSDWDSVEISWDFKRHPLLELNKKTCIGTISTGQVVNSLEELLEQIQRFTKEHGDYANNENRKIVFRGQANASWPLLSSISRSYRNESDVMKQLTCEKPDISKNGQFALIAYGQHCGTMTRFIDFTTSPEIALYFACEQPETNGRLIMTNYSVWHPQWTGVSLITELALIDSPISVRDFAKMMFEKHPEDMERYRYIDAACSDIFSFAGYGFMVVPTEDEYKEMQEYNPNIVAQSGAFFINGTSFVDKNGNPVAKGPYSSADADHIFLSPNLSSPDWIIENLCTELIIPSNIKQEVIQYLSTKGITECSVFPKGKNGKYIKNQFFEWEAMCENRFHQLKANEEELNRIFIDIYGLQDELTPEVEDKDVTVRRADLGREIRSLLPYAVGCMFGRYSLYKDGLIFAGGEWNYANFLQLANHPESDAIPNALASTPFLPDKDNVIPITDEEYLEDDIVGRVVEFVRTVYGADTLEENLRFIADALGGKGNSAREIIRGYFLRDFYKDHVKIYQKRPIYWLFDSGKENGFKALIYLHRYDQDTVGRLRIDYLHKLQRIYESEIDRMRDNIENSGDARTVASAQKRLEKLTKQLKEAKEYDEKISHLALSRIPLDLDDGVKVNYEKLQTGADGKKLDVLGKI